MDGCHVSTGVELLALYNHPPVREGQVKYYTVKVPLRVQNCDEGVKGVEANWLDHMTQHFNNGASLVDGYFHLGNMNGELAWLAAQHTRFPRKETWEEISQENKTAVLIPTHAVFRLDLMHNQTLEWEVCNVQTIQITQYCFIHLNIFLKEPHLCLLFSRLHMLSRAQIITVIKTQKGSQIDNFFPTSQHYQWKCQHRADSKPANLR